MCAGMLIEVVSDSASQEKTRKPFSRYEALSAASLSLEDLSRDLRA